MVGPTLLDIRDHIESLAAADGRYYVVCGRTGDRPVPAAGQRFPDRATARAAARATEQYRAALRRYDPQVRHHDPVVCEAVAAGADPAGARPGDGDRDAPPAPRSAPTATGEGGPARRDLAEFCHRVAGAVFEALSAAGHDGVERAVMDAYFELAERVGDPDELCLRLLESAAAELDARLAPPAQVGVLTGAAARLSRPAGEASPLAAALTALRRRGLVERYTRSPHSVAPDGGTGSVVVRVAGYALSARDGRLPVLPLTVELCRRRPARPPHSVRAAAVDGGWRLTVGFADGAPPDGLASAPVEAVG